MFCTYLQTAGARIRLGHESGFHYLLATLNCFELDIHSMTAGIGSRNSGPIYPKILKL